MKTGNSIFHILTLTTLLAMPLRAPAYVTLNSSANNFTFQGDTTYYINGPVVLTGTNTLEGGTVIKYAKNSNAYIYFAAGSTLIVNTSPYRPAVFTAVDDNTVGESIGNGTPAGYYGNMGLYADLPANSGLVLHNLRMSYLAGGLGFPSNCPKAVRDLQFVNCQSAVSSGSGTCRLQNVLVQGGGSVFLGNINASCENVTFHQVTSLVQSGPSANVCFTNSLIAMVNTNGAAISGINNQFLTSDIGIFQIAGGGADYLATNCPAGFRDAGTTNIDPALLADLQTKTTYPPIVYRNVTFTTNLTLSPQAQRDTNAMPDLGYHYDPLDYAFGGSIGNSNITFTAGTAVGWFRTSSGYGIQIGQGLYLQYYTTVSFQGTVQAPDYWVRLNTVQENDTSGIIGLGPGGLTGGDYLQYSNSVLPAPVINLSFTRCSMIEPWDNHFRDDYHGCLIVVANHCEFYNGAMGGYGNSCYFTNCLMERTQAGQVYGCSGDQYIMRNCTWRGGSLYLEPYNYPIPISVRDCSFDGTTITLNSYGINPGNADYDYNAFPNGMSRFPIGGTHDVIVTNSFNWQSSWKGNYYLPNDSPLLYHGDVPASQLGLDAFTIRTDQAVEGTNIVSIGYHYVPVSLTTPPIITSDPQDTYVDAYGSASFSVSATGAWTYQWLLNGSNVLNGTSSTLTLSNIVQSELGQYSVIVGNGFGSVTSLVANLYMYPSIVTPFTGVVTDWGQPTTLSVAAWGSGMLTYQWFDNGVAVPNATNSTMTFSAIQFTNAGLYSVVVSNSLGTATNTAAQVVVNPSGVSLGLYPGITVTGTVGYTYVIQSNPDLTNTNGWTTVATLTLFQPVELWVDVNNNAASPTNQHRFYRVLPAQ